MPVSVINLLLRVLSLGLLDLANVVTLDCFLFNLPLSRLLVEGQVALEVRLFQLGWDRSVRVIF